MEACSCNHCFCGKATSIAYSECVFVALLIQHAMRMRRNILSSVASLSLPYVSTLSRKRDEFLVKNIIDHEICVVIFSIKFVWRISHHKKNWERYDLNVYWSLCKVPIQLVRNCPDGFLKCTQISNFMKIRKLKTKLFHMGGRTYGRTDGQRDRRTDMTKRIVGFRNYENAPKNKWKCPPRLRLPFILFSLPARVPWERSEPR
jgi:hypothetical protein